MPKMVLVHWSDSTQAASHWQWLDEIETPPIVRCQTVGWLVKECETEINIALSLGCSGDREQVAGVMTIPRSCIYEICVLAAERAAQPTQ